MVWAFKIREITDAADVVNAITRIMPLRQNLAQNMAATAVVAEAVWRVSATQHAPVRVLPVRSRQRSVMHIHPPTSNRPPISAWMVSVVPCIAATVGASSG
ncbi:hypothetical protein ACFROC_01700 [Nocardia tengchongensis]|uniref:hypothetical protein n=1 Tax=Nocardia tengchongensis TaxID=2055889 RepID=UPI0036B0B190